MKNLLSALISVAVLMSLPVLAAQDCPDRLVGVWGAEVSFGPQIRGTLTIFRRGTEWNASISGFDVVAQVNNGGLRFHLPGNRGEFRGRLVDHARNIEGQWIQPVLAHVWGVSYATPVELISDGKDIWRGSVLPLDDSENIYVSVTRDSSGVFDAFVRSPERNLGRYLGPMRIDCAED